MPGTTIGLVTALVLAGAAPRGPAQGQDFRLGARQWAPAPMPFFGPAPPAAPRGEMTQSPSCRMPVLHGDPAIDPAFVIPVPSGPGVPAYTMRWAPSSPCDPARAGDGGAGTARTPKGETLPRR